MIDHDRDKTLVALMAAGDECAIGQLYDQHCKRLMGIAFKLLNSRIEAEDLLHDLFLEVWNTAKQYDPERGTVLSWLMIKLRSRAIDRRRSWNRHATSVDLEIVDQARSISDEWQIEANVKALNLALQKLSEPHRTVVQLTYYHGLTYEEVAAHAGIPVGTVKSRLAKAKDKLGCLLNATVGSSYE
jgi:RNA polymerase sigma-70 factor (ECF subfamily)